jgi:glycine/D-amino acid oxidase-like deaminating enzyme
MRSMEMQADVAIFGGGCAGLWLLDELVRRGARAVLFESGRLGDPQTAVSQGILHGGLKYSLGGLLSSSAKAVRDMPAMWSAALSGHGRPDLSHVRLRSRWCYLWRGGSLGSWAGMLGAVAALAVRPVALDDAERPTPLARCPGQVYRLEEPVIDPISFLRVMATRHRARIWRIDPEHGLDFERTAAGRGVAAVRALNPATGNGIRLSVQAVVFCAGEGNEALRRRLDLPCGAMQRRPLRVALVRGALPGLCGHVIEGAKTRVTVTSDVDARGRTVWQLGGQVSEDGASMRPEPFIEHARRELSAVLPGWQMHPTEWASFEVDRAERATGDGSRPGDVQIVREGNIVSAWPTKLVLAPRLAQCVADLLETGTREADAEWEAWLGGQSWPSPEVAPAPWERELTWINAA